MPDMIRTVRHGRASWVVTFGAGALLVGALAPSTAWAQGDLTAARNAYDRGAASYDAGEFALAAAQLAQADAILPNDVALELAIKAAAKANDPILVMELASRADGRSSASLAAVRDEARAKAAGRVGRVNVSCPPDATCTTTLDDAPFPPNQTRWVLVGEHRVVVDAGGQKQAFRVRIDPGANVPVVAAAPLTTPTPPTSRDSPPTSLAPARDASSGVSPVWFWTTAGISAVVGGLTIASAVDTRNTYEAFSSRPSPSLSNEGVDAQLRTNLLLAGTAASVIATAVVGIFFVRWSGPARTADARGPARGAW